MKPKYKINKQYLIIEYNKKLKTIFEIANQIGCNSWVIKNRMKKYNIKIRKHGGTKKLRGTYKKENNPAWKGGKPKCKCGKALSTNRTRQCHSCKWLAEKNPNFKSGKPKCIDCNKIIAYPSKRCSHCAKIGELHPNWIGSTPLKDTIRHLREYKIWRDKIFKRDNYTCQECNQQGIYLEAHHIKSFAELLSEFLKEYDQFSPIEDKETLVRLVIKWKPFWEIDNGKTLCRDCHDLTKIKGGEQGGQ